MIVGGWHAVDLEEGKELVVIAFGVQHALSKVFGFGVWELGSANFMQPGIEFGNPGTCGAEGDRAGITLAAQIAGVGKEFAQLKAESDRVDILCRGWG